MNCNCPPDFCAEFVEPREHCVFSMEGKLTREPCDDCNGTGTWHLDGQCLRCQALQEKELETQALGRDA